MRTLTLISHMMKMTLSQKITACLFAVVVFLIFIFVFSVNIDASDGVIQSVSIYGSRPISGIELSFMIPKLAEIFSALIFFATVVLSIIATAHIIPDAINNRTLVLFITKRMSRGSVIIALFAGVTAAVILMQIAILAGLWIVLTAKTGIWNFRPLLSIIPLGVSFGTLYAFMVYIGVIGKSTGLVTAVAIGHVLLLSPLLTGGHLAPFAGESGSLILQNIFRAVMPNIHELKNIFMKFILSQQADPALILISILPCSFFIWLSIRILRRMDF